MTFRFTAVPVHGGAEAEQMLNAFLCAYRVLTVERHLVDDGAQSVWAICVAYTDATAPAQNMPGRTGMARKDRIAYKHVLRELEFALAGAQTLPCAERAQAATDQIAIAIATRGACRRRTQRGPRGASSGSGCAVERSPGLRLSEGWAQ